MILFAMKNETRYENIRKQPKIIPKVSSVHQSEIGRKVALQLPISSSESDSQTFWIPFQEWSKYSNYVTATRVPWLMHIPKSLGGRHQLSSAFGSKQLKKRLAASLDDNLRGDNQLLL